MASTVADLLSAFSGGTLASITPVLDTAANVDANIDALQAVASSGLLGAIRLSNGGRPAIAVTTAQVSVDAAVLSQITTPYFLEQRTAAAQVTSAILGAPFHAIAVVDSAANIAANLSAIEARFKTGSLGVVRMTDKVTPVFSLTAAQVEANADVLSRITAPDSITLTDPGTPTITLPVWDSYTSIYTNVVAHITTPFTLAFGGVIRPGSVASIEVGVDRYHSDNVTGLPANPIAPLGTVNAALLPDGLQVLDYQSRLSEFIDSLQIAAQAGKLASVTLRDGGPQILSLSPQELTNDALALSKFSPNVELSQIIIATQAAAPPVLEPGFFNYTVQDSLANVMANIGAIDTLARTGLLGKLRFLEAAPDIRLTAAQLSQTAFALSFAFESSLSITLTDPGTPTVTIGGDMLNIFNVRNSVLTHVTGPYNLAVSGVIDAFVAANIVSENNKVLASLTSVRVSDFAGDIVTNLDALEALAAAGKLTAIDFVGGGVPVFNISPATATADAAALAKITSPYILSPPTTTSVSSAAFLSQIVSLEAQVEAGMLSSVSLTDGGTPVLSTTAAILAKNLTAFSKISSPYTIALTNPGTPALVLQPWQVNFSTLSVLSAAHLPGAFTFSISGPLSASAAATLAFFNFGAKLTGKVAIADQSFSVSNNIDGLQGLATAGNLASITLLDGGVPTLSIGAAKVSADATALALITSPHAVSNLNQFASLSSAAFLAQLVSLEAQVEAGTLGSVFLTDGGTPLLSTTAAILAANLAAFGKISNVYTVTLTDPGTPALVLQSWQVNFSTLSVLSAHLPGAFTFSISGPLSASAAATLASFNFGAKLTGTIAIADQSFNVSSNINALQALAAVGKLASITMLDGGVPTLFISAAQVSADATALALITSPHTVSGTIATSTSLSSTAFLAQLVSLETQVEAGTLSAVSLTDGGTPVLSTTAAILAKNLAAFGRISSPYTIALTNPGTPALVLQPWQVNFSTLSVLSAHLPGAFTFSISGPLSASAATTLASFNFGAKLTGKVAIEDQSFGVSNNIDALQALATAGKLASITLLDGGVPTLAISTAKVSADATALALITSPHAVSNLNQFASLSSAAFLSQLVSLEAQVEAGTLGSVSLTDFGIPVLSTTAAILTTNLAAFGSMFGAYTITLTDPGTPALVLQPWQVNFSTLSVLSAAHLPGAFTFSISGPLSASAAATLASFNFGAKLTGKVVIEDQSFGVSNNIDALQALATAGKLASITLLDGGVPTLSMSAAKVSADATALALITSPHAVSSLNLFASLSSAAFLSQLVSLEAQVEAGTLGSVFLTDGGTPLLSTTAAILAANLAAFGKISNAYTITLTDPGTPTLDLKPWQVTAQDLSVLSKISGPFGFSVSGDLSASQGLAIAGSAVLADLTGQISIADFSNNLSVNFPSNMAGLETIFSYGHLGSVTLFDGGARIPLTLAQATGGVDVLNALTSPYSLSEVVTAAAAASTAIPSGQFASLTVQDSEANVIANLASLEQLAVSGKLMSILFTGLVTPISMPAATFAANADALRLASGYSVTLTDLGTPTVTLQDWQLVANSSITNLLNRIATPYTLAVNGPIRPNTAATLVNGGPGIVAKLAPNSLVIRDTSNNFQAFLPQLLTLATAGKIASIDTRNGGIQDWSITPADAATYAPVLSLVTTPFILGQIITVADLPNPVLAAGFKTFTIRDSVANVLGALPQIEALAVGGQLGELLFTDTAPRIVTSAANIMSAADVWNVEDFSPYPVVLTNPGTPVITLPSYELGYNMRNDILDNIAGPWSLRISGNADAGTLAVITEEHNGVLAHLAGPIAVADYSFNVQPYLDQLEYLTLAGKIGSITLIDGGTPTLSLSIQQDASDLDAIAKIVGPFHMAVTGDASANHIIGGPGSDTLNGLAGNDILDGKGGADTMAGGTGNDIYVVDNAGDTIVEAPGVAGGTDTVQSALISLNLAKYANVENVTLTGALVLAAIGNTGDNIIDGSANTAANVLTGLAGNDTYIVGTGDTIVEAPGVAGGTDTVQSALISLDLANYPNVENVTLTGKLALSATGNAGNNVIDGSADTSANVLTGLAGNDTYIVGAGDTIVEAAGAAGGTDTVQSSLISLNLANYANVENMKLTGALALSATGNAGNNVIDGSADTAANVLTGGAGNDTYFVGTGDKIVEAVGDPGGTDTVQSSLISLNLANYANVENVTLTGALALSATGNAGANVIDGSANTAANVLTGLAGNDTYIVGTGDTIVEAAGAAGGTDTVQSSLISLNLANYPNVENMKLTGALALSATGNAGNNVIDGSANTAANVLTGLAGSDTYIVGTGDTIVEAAGAAGGTDAVQSSLISLNLANYANVENVTLTGALALSATGNAGANVIDGSADTAANVLTGGAGNDTYVVGTGDTIVEAAGAAGGTDTVQSSLISLNLANYPNVENMKLTGALALSATGNAGANLIDGSADTAANVLTGLAGNDTYIVGTGDTIVEAVGAAGGTDTIQSSLISLNLANYANVENMKLTGALALSATGNAGANVIDGSADTSANVLTGLAGDDTYIVGTGDTIVEAAGAAGGTDTVQSSLISLNLANYANVENMKLTGALALSATGNAGNNVIDGSADTAANVLTGGAGNDTYVVGTGDTVIETAGGGSDTVMATANYALGAGQSIEFLRAAAGATGLTLTGNELSNTIVGGSGADTLVGGAGSDTLIGGAGADVFSFLAASDSAVGAGRDTIQDFSAAQGDIIDLSSIDANDLLPGNQAFSFLGTGAFTGAHGELRYDVVGSDSIVQGTISGVGVDFEIKVAGAGVLSGTDFRL